MPPEPESEPLAVVPPSPTRPPSSDEHVRDEALWLEDGDLILVAARTEFCVYREPLLQHSTVLRDMVLTQGADRTDRTSSDTLETVPATVQTLRLSDTPEDLRYFLLAFFAGLGTPLRVGLLHPTFHELSAHIRLGRKYGVEPMVQAGVEYLQIYFPDTSDLSLWDLPELFHPPGFEANQIVGIVNLARLTGTTSILPSALINASVRGKDLVKGFTRADGTQETLTKDDLIRVMNGRILLSRACASATHKVFRPEVADACTRPDVCGPALERMVQHLSDNENYLFHITFRPKTWWTFCVEQNDSERLLCSKCFNMVGRWECGRQEEQSKSLLAKLWDIWDLKKDDGGDARKESQPRSPVEPTKQEPPSTSETTRSVGVQTELYHRDSEFWFENGNLTLIARDVEFRVWKAPLAAHSLVFRDMFSLPQPEAETGQGSSSPTTPIIHLSESPDELRQCLRVFFPGKTLRIARANPTYHEVSAQIRLGHKYQIDQMVQRNVDHLKKYYTDDFDAWFDVSPLEPPGFDDVHSLGAINLARLTGTHSVLSTAILSTSLLDSAKIIEGFSREDGSHETLSQEDVGRCICGKWETTEASLWALHKVFSGGPSTSCIRTGQCKQVIQKMLDGVMHDDERAIKMKWWESWKDYIEEVDEERELCWACYNAVSHERKKEAERAIFDRMAERLELTETTKDA
ncbi:hypothetical protein C8Q80DRAFT_1273169 [Daedaleopsis nitida]|nr:hypothetical protein C8Q80DRAFT_1273169 [Daedaleopsis nitida]